MVYNAAFAEPEEWNEMPGALEGLKVVDLSRVLGGPYCAQMLADHGAEVIKVEPPQGDETRLWGPPFDQEGISAYYSGINRNKRTIALDLSKPEGRSVLMKLLETADVLIENFKTGTMEKWGIGYDTLSASFPRLIHARVSGFGADGPLGGFPGYDAMVQASAGLVSVNGSPDSDPVRVGVPVVDLSTGMNACMGILMSLYERNRSGKGQFVDATLYDSAVALHQPHAPNYFMGGLKPKRYGNSHGNLVPYANFPTKGRNIVIGAADFGLLAGGQKLASMIVYDADIIALGLDKARGLLMTTAYYWDLDDKTRSFAERFFKRRNTMPNMIQASIYSSVSHYLKAAKAAGSFEPDKIVPQMQAMPVDDMFATNGKVRPDGLMQHDTYLLEAKAPSESKSKWDILKLVRRIPGDVGYPPLSASKCPTLAK